MQVANENVFHPAATVEVLVIGGGVIGSSIAYHVARQGRTVLVIERGEVAREPAASWASAGAYACGNRTRLKRHWPSLPSRTGLLWQRNWMPTPAISRAAT